MSEYLKKIEMPTLGESDFGSNLKEQFENIDSNFKILASADITKGRVGDSAVLITYNLNSIFCSYNNNSIYNSAGILSDEQYEKVQSDYEIYYEICAGSFEEYRNQCLIYLFGSTSIGSEEDISENSIVGCILEEYDSDELESVDINSTTYYAIWVKEWMIAGGLDNSSATSIARDNVSDFPLGCIIAACNVSEENGVSAVATMGYMVLDTRFRNSQLSGDLDDDTLNSYIGLLDISGVVIGVYNSSSDEMEFEYVVAQVNMYYNDELESFCWVLNGQKTSISAQGYSGSTSSSSSSVTEDITYGKLNCVYASSGEAVETQANNCSYNPTDTDGQTIYIPDASLVISSGTSSLSYNGFEEKNLSFAYMDVELSDDVSTLELSPQIASNGQPGIVEIGSNISVSDGKISVPVAASDTLGVVQIGSNISVSDGEISVPVATSDTLGVVRIGSGINVDSNGKISVESLTITASSSDLYWVGVSSISGSQSSVYYNSSIKANGSTITGLGSDVGLGLTGSVSASSANGVNITGKSTNSDTSGAGISMVGTSSAGGYSLISTAASTASDDDDLYNGVYISGTNDSTGIGANIKGTSSGCVGTLISGKSSTISGAGIVLNGAGLAYGVYITNAWGDSSSNNSSYDLYVDGTIGVSNGVYDTSSDVRLKTVVSEDFDALKLCNKLKPVTFRWNEFAKKLHPEYNMLDLNYGIIAQNSTGVIDGLVRPGRTENDIWRVSYSRLVPVLLKAVQELNSKSTDGFDELESENKYIKKELASLKKENKVLKQNLIKLENKFNKLLETLN